MYLVVLVLPRAVKGRTACTFRKEGDSVNNLELTGGRSPNLPRPRRPSETVGPGAKEGTPLLATTDSEVNADKSSTRPVEEKYDYIYESPAAAEQILGTSTTDRRAHIVGPPPIVVPYTRILSLPSAA
jgi:hypothetical protein